MAIFRPLPAVATALLALAAAGSPALATPQEFAIDPTHSQVHVTWNHGGFSNPGATFTVGEGKLVLDEDDPARSSVQVRIPVTSVNTQVPALDALFKGEYFKLAEHPAISFSSARVERVDAAANRYRIEGTLSVNGISRDVTLDATLNRSGIHPMLDAPAVGFDASATLKRSDFGLDAFVPIVSDEIRVQITVEAAEPEALARAAAAAAAG